MGLLSKCLISLITFANWYNPFNNNGGAQSKAAAAAGFVPQQQVGFMAQPQAMYNPQQAAQTVMGAMPNYGG